MARIHLTGGVRAEGPAGAFADADLPGAQGRLTFAILVVERRAIARDELAELVWDGILPEQWNAALTAIVSKLRKLVTEIGLDGRRIVTSASGICAIALPSDAWVDLEDAYRRLDRAEGALRYGDHGATTVDATVASAIFRRPILPGVVSGWVDEQRRFHDAALYRCLTVLAEAWIALGNHPLAATIADDAIHHDPLRELAYRLLITAELGRGDRAAAWRVFERCALTLRDELGVAPSPETTALVAHLAT